MFLRVWTLRQPIRETFGNSRGMTRGMMHRMQKLLLLLGGLGGVLCAQQSVPPGMQCPQRTLVTWELGPHYADREQFASQHFAYMARQMKAGALIMAGPLADGQRAVGLFSAKDWPEVEAILKDEPFTRAGVLKVADHAVWTACAPAP